MAKSIRYNIIFRPEPEGGFTVIVPSLPGCVSYGKNLSEAKKMAIDAIKGYVASLKKHGDSIPTDEENFFTSVEVSRAGCL
ncbi:MAG: antitoxin HicB [Candidatus Staskawiczbacteria bacterium RIFCSPLOWO2_01_FULL_37_25b]|uniref:Antitoxin HicB n=1 Tax=Candidatus Staskawiczbacteria bacterium RIFCSPLOWO2_01_FULL_37_25b TaxID=1802213 RepID=A0A1G2IB73_9BACT|nr:MAG: antitoxin HicB [Candidatus Staskawiczbacteria bacterium RIFCSPLOWO2_01_FULL_37_25b]